MNDASLSLSLVSTSEGLADLAPEWDALVLAASRPCPFLLHGWVSAWWRHLGGGAQLAVVTARRGGRLMGLAPMVIQRRHGLRVCRLLGGNESALGDLLVARSEDASTACALMERVSRLEFDYLDVFGVPDGGELARVAAAHELADIVRVEAPVLNMPDGWEAAYESRTHAKKRALHRRRLRHLSELGPLTWTTARSAPEVESELEHAFLIHARRWDGRPDGSTFGQPGARAFHRAAARALAQQDAVRIVTLRVAGRPVAFQYSFVIGTTLYLHRIAFDPELARHSPGQVTLLHAIGDASAEGVRRVELLGGTERYKLELADRFEPLHEVIGMPRNPFGHAATRALRFVIAARLRLRNNERVHRVYMEGLAPLRRLFRRNLGDSAP
jgi:CelD/BcsL family acetyltransferase involved in cellulose biosynthesis